MPVTPPPASGGGGGGSVVFYDEGSAIGTGSILNFVGAGVTGTFSGGTAVATIAGGTAAGSVVIREEGSAVGTATDINFVGSATTATFSGGTATITTTAGGTDDPVADVFGAADTAYEFDTSSLSGLTAMQTPDSEDADTTVPGHLYLKDNAGGASRCGRYHNGLSTPFTVITKISDANVQADYHQVGLFVGESTPGGMRTIQWAAGGRLIQTESQTPTTFVGSISSGLSDLQTPLYFGIVVNSGTDIDFLYSYGGRIWRYMTEAHNSGLTIASAGVVIAANNVSGVAAAFDYLRIWNSAKTFPGVY